MRGHQDGTTLVELPADHCSHKRDTRAVEIREGLIQDPERCGGQHHPCHGDPAALPCGADRGRFIGRVRKADAFQYLDDLRGFDAPSQTDLKCEILAGAQFRFQPVTVREVAQVGTVRIAVRSDRSSTPGDTPLLRRQESSKDTEKSCFSRSVRTGDMDAIARDGLDGNPADHLAVAAPDMDIARGKS